MAALNAVSDEQLLEEFERGTLVAESFHHADHARMAFLYLHKYPVTEALERFCGALARFAANQGKPERYHETVTWAYVLLIRERLARADRRQSWEEFAAENGDLLDWTDNILGRYYRKETLESNIAKRVFVLPDGGCHRL
jgi:hypothetical protein